MPTIIATPKAVDANAYATRAQVTAYFTNRLYADTWTAASDDNKDAAIIWATAIMERAIVWQGYITTQEQALQHPRTGLFDRAGRLYDQDEICPPVIEATAELAMALLKFDRTKEHRWLGLGVSDVLIGSIRAVVNRQNRFDVIPPHVLHMLDTYGVLNPAFVTSGMKVVKLLRT